MTETPSLIDLPMPIITPRLTLRPAMPGDGAALHEAKLETWDILARWMPWAKEKSSTAEDEAFSRDSYERFMRREDLLFLGFDRASGRLILATGLHRFNWEVRRFEIGYWVRKSAQGQGYAQECANALTRYAFAALKARAVAINAADGNEASLAVIQKLGFTKEGTNRYDTLLPTGAVVDGHSFSRTDLNGLPELSVHWGADDSAASG